MRRDIGWHHCNTTAAGRFNYYFFKKHKKLQEIRQAVGWSFAVANDHRMESELSKRLTRS